MAENKVRDLIKQRQGNKKGNFIEKIIPIILFLIACVSVLTTLGIVFTLLFETITFFTRVSIVEFFTNNNWAAFNAEPEWGIFPLVLGTLKITAIAAVVSVPLGLGAAIYLSEYATDKARRIIKPILEVLAGIPTIVYGFFALTFVTPLLKNIVPDLNIFNALSPGIVVGIMIIPMIASLSEDAMNSVPNALREGALGLGATKFEVAMKVVLPAALSGILASVVLGLSRAIGETMIVSIAAGSSPNNTLSITDTIQTMTGYIVQVATGDATYGSDVYFSLYAVGTTLFVFTLVMNIISQWITRRFREEY
ncbi:phosphate ABC transporter permease subunit PstC [Abyssicoccus albus]|uniref:Phosphate transport system permease protein n=1 Tax=Abyssicoccus albus TaxID=1817405 RepID=A0A3N5C6X4_9BACL|nr:phosphate ABC transporter membrane protein 1 (PhoT family) [Abyssicoccus albus]